MQLTVRMFDRGLELQRFRPGGLLKPSVSLLST
jgi:hypothetical protein